MTQLIEQEIATLLNFLVLVTFVVVKRQMCSKDEFS